MLRSNICCLDDPELTARYHELFPGDVDEHAAQQEYLARVKDGLTF